MTNSRRTSRGPKVEKHCSKRCLVAAGWQTLKFRAEKLAFLFGLCDSGVSASHRQLRLRLTAVLQAIVRPSPEFNDHCFLLLPLHDIIQYIQSYTTIHTGGVEG